MTDPALPIVAELIALLNRPHFSPFVIVLSDGLRHEIVTSDHCTVTRLLRRIEIEHDNGTIAFVNPLHIVRLELLHRPAA